LKKKLKKMLSKKLVGDVDSSGGNGAGDKNLVSLSTKTVMALKVWTVGGRGPTNHSDHLATLMGHWKML